jgi:hypothetical protein
LFRKYAVSSWFLAELSFFTPGSSVGGGLYYPKQQNRVFQQLERHPAVEHYFSLS